MQVKTLIATILVATGISVAHAEEPEWVGTLERISTGVVSIRVDSTRAFDTEWNTSSQATGFVVDAERGIILTNRHVVTPGPVVAEAVFLNNEEVRLTPVYRDPVHDFGFFRYDPDDLVYITPAELPLVPGAAGIGREIRVVGNDAGEQLSILAGTIARLDRRAPDYGRGKYNDFNTFYFQAASGTSGGSSGSPVVNIDGEVVALNAGGHNSAASSFFLPLDRVDRALQLLQDDAPISRGTLQTVFVRKAYDELRRLGLSDTSEKRVREAFPDQTGMLTVQQTIPNSPAHDKLEAGDILIAINDELVTEFVPLAAVLDDSVGDSVKVTVERAGKAVDERLRVSDLHAITPDEFVEFGDAIVNDLSYQQARHYNRAVTGVYVADPGYVLSKSAIPRGAVISEVDDEPVEDVDDLIRMLGKLADGDRANFRYHTIDDPNNSIKRSVQMDRTWFPAQRCSRNDDSGSWPCEDLAGGPSRKPAETGSTSFRSFDDPRVDKISASLVMVTFDLPYSVSGIADRHYYGTGLVVDTERGLVIVDRNTVPIGMGDVTVTFAGSLQVDGAVEYVHPLHNVAMISYDPSLIGDTPVRAATFSNSVPDVGDSVLVVGLKSDHQLARQQSNISSIDPITLPLSRTMRFRDTNLEAISLVNGPTDFDGVLVDERGDVLASWSTFAYQAGGDANQITRGIGADVLVDFVATVQSDQPVYSLEAELNYVPLFAARKLGLEEDWLARLEAHNPHKRRALRIARLVAGTSAADELKNGDIVLAINGQIVTSFREMEQAVRDAQVEVTVWRDKKAIKIDVDTAMLDGNGVDRVVAWAGALLQTPHRGMAAQRGIDPSGVYVAFFNYGSPATRYGLWAGRRIVAVDGIDTPDLQSFIDLVATKDDQDSVRLKTVTWNGVIEVITLKLDNQYWPAYEIRKQGDGWQRHSIG